jgi:thioredoxin-related protein
MNKMKKKTPWWTVFLLLLPFILPAQEKGIQFEHGLSWKEVQAKAKTENKYIFMDCFTTWCGPCKQMSAEIFPQEEVGTFFNKHFVSVQVQIDRTSGDNEAVKKWYDDAKLIESSYSIQAYPTFLYFSPDGRLVHRVVGGGEAAVFIEKSAAALDPSKQYYTLMDKYNKGSEKEPGDIRRLALVSLEAYDQKNAIIYADEYLKTQKNLFTKENIEFLSQFTNNSKAPGFDVFLNHGDQADSFLGKGQAHRIVSSIILREEVYPKISRDKNAPAPDWPGLQADIEKKYPGYSEEIVCGFKVQYFQVKKDWSNFQPAVTEYISKYESSLSPMELNNFAWTVFENYTDVKFLEEALVWSRSSLKDKEDPMFMDTYANLLYKIGKKEDAVAWEQKAINLSTDKKVYQESLDKMNNGEKTWPE